MRNIGRKVSGMLLALWLCRCAAASAQEAGGTATPQTPQGLGVDCSDVEKEFRLTDKDNLNDVTETRDTVTSQRASLEQKISLLNAQIPTALPDGTAPPPPSLTRRLRKETRRRRPREVCCQALYPASTSTPARRVNRPFLTHKGLSLTRLFFDLAPTPAHPRFGQTKGEKTMALLNAVIDLSHFNTVTSFHQVKDAGILGVIHKATQGKHSVDPFYDERRPAALAAGLLWGAYHFGTGGDPVGQADHFLDVVNPGPTDLLVLDFEPNPQGPTMALAEAETFVRRINDQTGRFPGLYSGESFINEQLGNNTDTLLRNCFLWIAKFSPDASVRPKVPPAFGVFTLFQYTDGANGAQPHSVPGVGRCDRDKFNGDEAGLRRLFGQP